MAQIGIERGEAARQSGHRADPAKDIAFDEVLAAMTQKARQRFERSFDQRCVIVIANRQGRLARQQPAKYAIRACGIAWTLVINAAAAERIEHEIRSGDLFAPEWLFEQDAHAHVVRRSIV